MARSTPIRDLHESAGVLLVPYGPAEAGVGLAEVFDTVETEYAAIRKDVGVLDEPNRAVLEVRGGEALDFLNRMLTQELKGLGEFGVRRSFWLNRKGRIDADIVVVSVSGRVLLDMDVHALGRTRESLDSYLFGEDCELMDLSDATHRFALHGPRGRELLARVGEPVDGAPAVEELSHDGATVVRIAGVEVVVVRQDTTGEIGLELIVPADAAEAVYREIAWIHAPVAPETPIGDRPTNDGRLARRIGWHAFNVARIEAGTPIYNLDFGPDSLPGESGVLRDRVSFTKGCYLGQEIVARMDALGHPKQIVRALDIAHRDGASSSPATGSAVVPAGKEDGAPIGAVTSATISPMLGARPIALAMLKWSHAAPATALRVQATADEHGSTAWLDATVREKLRFWPAEE